MDTETGPINIGVTAPLSGEAASFGTGLAAGVNLAAQEINEAGGVNGRMIELVYEDDECTGEKGANAMSKLVNIDQVDAVVGPMCSTVGGPALPIAQQAGVPYF